MGDKERKHFFKISKKFKPEDYERLEKNTLWMLGEITEEDEKFIATIPKRKK